MVRDSVFRSGTLDLPLFPAPREPFQADWIDMGVNRILAVATVMLVLLLLKSIVRVAPGIGQSLARSRGCLNLEHSYNMARLREICAIAAVLPFCLIADRYGFLPFLFGWNLPQWAGSLSVFCVLASYVLLRRLACRIASPGRMDYDYSNALAKTCFTVFTVLCAVMLVSLVVFLFLDLPDGLCRTVFMVEIVFCYAFSLVRSVQFLSAYCGGFATFLYLCALEFIPLAAVVAVCMCLRM